MEHVRFTGKLLLLGKIIIVYSFVTFFLLIIGVFVI